MSEYSVGDTWVDETRGMALQVQAVEYTYEVQYRPVDGDGDESDVETANYPEDSLTRKLESGDWTVPDEEESDEESGQTFVCKFCDDTFDNEQGLRTHVGMVHDVTDDDE